MLQETCDKNLGDFSKSLSVLQEIVHQPAKLRLTVCKEQHPKPGNWEKILFSAAQFWQEFHAILSEM